MGGSLPWEITTLACLVAKDNVVVGIWWLKGKIPHAITEIHHYCLSLKHTACEALTSRISGRRHNQLPVCSMKDVRSWSHVPTLKTDRNYAKNFWETVLKQRQEGQGEEENKQHERQLQSFQRYTQYLLCTRKLTWIEKIGNSAAQVGTASKMSFDYKFNHTSMSEKFTLVLTFWLNFEYFF